MSQHKQLEDEDRAKGYFLKEGQVPIYAIYSNYNDVINHYGHIAPIRDLRVPISIGRNNTGLNDIPLAILQR